MFTFIAIIVILILSIILTFRSMRDFNIPAEVRKLLKIRKIKGTIVFLKDKIKHYSSSSSS